MPHAVEGSGQSIDWPGQLMDQTIGSHLIDALLKWVSKFPSIGCQLIDPYITQPNLSIAQIHQMHVTYLYC